MFKFFDVRNPLWQAGFVLGLLLYIFVIDK